MKELRFYISRGLENVGGGLGSGDKGGRNINFDEADFIDMGPLSRDSGFNVVAHGVKNGIVVIRMRMAPGDSLIDLKLGPLFGKD